MTFTMKNKAVNFSTLVSACIFLSRAISGVLGSNPDHRLAFT